LLKESQIVSNPAKAAESNLVGITHVVSRMEWYCVLVEHLLHKDHIVDTDKPLSAILEKLEENVVELYKNILVY